MNKYMQQIQMDLQRTKNYLIIFYNGEDICVTAKDAAKAKYAILNEIKCFSVGDSLYMMSNIAGITRQRGQETRFLFSEGPGGIDQLDPPEGYKEAMKHWEAGLSMNSYFDGELLLDSPKLKLLKSKKHA